MVIKIILNLPKRTTNVIVNHVQRRHMPVNVPPTATGKRRFRLPVETDPEKLVNYCCGLNYHVDEPLIKLKPDNEYPEWLWSLRLEPKLNSWEMVPGTKEYWLQLNEEERQRNYLRKMRAERTKKVVGKVLKSQADYLHHIRFAALAHLESDAGFEASSMEPDWHASEKIYERSSDYYLPLEEDRVLYMDKIEGNIRTKNHYYDTDSSFKATMRMKRYRPNLTPAIQDSRRRHRYAGT